MEMNKVYFKVDLALTESYGLHCTGGVIFVSPAFAWHFFKSWLSKNSTIESPSSWGVIAN